jgi:hypothetical protein
VGVGVGVSVGVPEPPLGVGVGVAVGEATWQTAQLWSKPLSGARSHG